MTVLNGRVQRFGADVNTDYIIAAQHKAASLDLAEMAKHTFEDIDPKFVERVRRGDILVANRNFGCGSSRETAVRVLIECGIAAVIAPSFARIFFRNAINLGLPALECETEGIEQDDHLEIDVIQGRITARERDITRNTTQLPPVMQALLEAGGLANYLIEHSDLVLPEDQTKQPAEGN